LTAVRNWLGPTAPIVSGGTKGASFVVTLVKFGVDTVWGASRGTVGGAACGTAALTPSRETRGESGFTGSRERSRSCFLASRS
jgi:hypothetical protein